MLKDLFYLFYPLYCVACDDSLFKHENLLCTTCRHKISLYDFNKVNGKKIEKVFYGRIKIENAIALFNFQKDSLVQNLIHNLKYKGREEIGKELGKWLGSEMNKYEEFNSIDVIVPVPLHKRRLKERGYNQVEKFGKEIAKIINAGYIDFVLKKVKYNTKQSRRNKISRWSNTNDTFCTQKESILENKHILLVDDIITTGSTIEACVNQLKFINGIKISIATIAVTE